MRWLLIASLLTACSRSPAPSTTLTVYAASSLTDVLTEIGGAFERTYPGSRVQFNFAGSQVLRLQIERGAPADVFLSADRQHLEALGDLVDETTPVISNRLALITPHDSSLRTFQDLAQAQRVVLGTPEVPIGRYVRQLLDRSGAPLRRSVLARVVSEESNVRLIRAKVQLGEADAAFVYASDVTSDVREIPIPPSLQADVSYVMALVAASQRTEQTARWQAFLYSAPARVIFERHGFRAD